MLESIMMMSVIDQFRDEALRIEINWRKCIFEREIGKNFASVFVAHASFTLHFLLEILTSIFPILLVMEHGKPFHPLHTRAHTCSISLEMLFSDLL